MKIKFSPFIAMIFLSACHFFGPIDESTLKPVIEKPDSSLFLGKWEADSFSRIDLKKYYKLDSPPFTLVLYRDGTFWASNFPDVYVVDRTDDTILANCSGKWTLQKRYREEHWQIELSFHEKMFYSTKELDFYDHINDGLVLWHFLGDPDMGARIMFKRQKILSTTAN